MAGTFLDLWLPEHIRTRISTGTGSVDARQRGENVARAAVHPGGEIAE